MNKPLSIIAGAALLGASLFPMSASASPATPGVYPASPAVCTQIEPIYRRIGISFYGGEKFCSFIAADPELFGWPALPLDPASTNMHLMCGYYVTQDRQEYALAWSVNGFETAAAEYCYSMRLKGTDVTFIDPAYS